MNEIDKIIPAINRHSFEQIKDIEKFCLSVMRRKIYERRECYKLLSELAQHGSEIFPYFETYIAKFDDDPRSTESRNIHRQIYKCSSEALNNPLACLDDTIRKSLYHPQRTVFFDNRNDRPIVIVFTTSFNNFYVSNPVFGEILAQAGFSFLFIKDRSGYQYTRGIPGISSDWETSIEQLGKFISKKRRNRKIIVIGFSSSGFSSILASLKLAPDLTVGFSIRSTMSNNSELIRSKVISSTMYNKIPIELQCDLKEKIIHSTPPIRLYYGQNSKNDKLHATRLATLNAVTVCEIPAVGHICFRPFLCNGDFAHLLKL